MEKVNDLVKEIKTNLTHASSSHKDEVRVMRAMLNDTSYEAGVYDKSGKISTEEADSLAALYDAKKSDAESMVTISKEFINTYLKTDRKIGLGGREKSNVSIIRKGVGASTRSYPKQVGIGADGKPVYEKAEVKVSPYESVKVYSPCPAWVKK